MPIKYFTYLLIMLICFCENATAQEAEDSIANDEETWVKPEINPEFKVGIKLGSGVSTMVGKESNTNKLYFNLMGGMYLKYRFKPHWFIQPEISVSRRGSNFDNGPAEYSRIQCYYLDFPLLFMRGINVNNSSVIAFGLQYSRLLNSSIYQYRDAYPQSSKPGLTKNDFMLVGGAQFHTPFVGFQFLCKYGLININDGLLPSLPPVSQGKSMHNLTIEFNFLF